MQKQCQLYIDRDSRVHTAYGVHRTSEAEAGQREGRPFGGHPHINHGVPSTNIPDIQEDLVRMYEYGVGKK
jgi:hypothetical protein